MLLDTELEEELGNSEPPENDDMEEEFIGITLSEVIAKYAKQAGMLLATCVTVGVMIYVMMMVYNTLGTPDASQQTGVGILEWRE